MVSEEAFWELYSTELIPSYPTKDRDPTEVEEKALNIFHALPKNDNGFPVRQPLKDIPELQSLINYHGYFKPKSNLHEIPEGHGGLGETSASC